MLISPNDKTLQCLDPQQLQPLRFTCLYKSVIWGGQRIAQFKGEHNDNPTVGESWELSAITGKESQVTEGPQKGMTLQQLIDIYGEEFLGSRLYKNGVRSFPLLIKLIDANQDLSLQVHPGEALARERHGCSGKAEMWYVIDSHQGSELWSGFRERLSVEAYRQSIEDGTILDAVASHQTHPGDVFYLPSGRIHAIGAGNLLLEVQQSSDVTYRIYDFGRGRELHTDFACDALDFNVRDDYRSVPHSLDEHEMLLAKVPEFEVHIITVDDKVAREFSGESFVTMTCVKGAVALHYQGNIWELKQGHTLLLPACVRQITLTTTQPGSSVVTATC